MKKLFPLFIIILLFAQCKSKEDKIPVHEGIVTYTLTYPAKIKEHSLSNILPKEMHLYFKANMIKYEIKGSFNFFSLGFISLSETDSCKTIFSTFGRTLVYDVSPKENTFLFGEYKKPIISYKNSDTKEIAGYNCKAAYVTFDTNSEDSTKIYYTTEIPTISANRHSSFREIPGVLMEFELTYQGQNFKISANKVESKKLNKDTFMYPKKFKYTTAKEIDKFIAIMIGS